MPTPEYPSDLGDDLATIRAQLRAAIVLAKSSAAKTKIYAQLIELLGRLLIKAGGVLEVQNAGGNTLLRAGQILLGDGSYVDGLAVFRPGGEVALAAFQSGADFVTVIYDRQSSRLVMPDEVAGQGLARPWLTHSFFPTQFGDLLGSNSGTFATLWTGGFYKQHAGLYVYGRYGSDSATAGELRVLVNGVQLGPTVTIGTFVQGTWSVGPAAVAGAHLSYLEVEIQVRRTAGAGLVKCAPVFMTGRQLP